jgi:hypothetical protein
MGPYEQSKKSDNNRLIVFLGKFHHHLSGWNCAHVGCEYYGKEAKECDES